MHPLLNMNPALILIDIQKGFDDLEYWGGQRNNPGAEENAKYLLDFWRNNKLPLFHVQHCSADPGSILAEGKPGNEIKEAVAPRDGETVIRKNVNSAFIGTALKQMLEDEQITTLVVVGLTTDHCVSTTTRMAGNYGYRTFVVADACAAFAKSGINGERYDAETIHLVALAHLKDEFATIVNTADIVGTGCHREDKA